MDELESEGLVVFAENPRHLRSPLVVITELGREANDRLFETSSMARRRSLRDAGIAVAELETARATVRRLLEAIGEID